MALEEGQWQIRDLVLGANSIYRLLDSSNPFDLAVRADQGGPRAWNHGSWSGAEWASERVVPIRLLIRDGDALTVTAWKAARDRLAAAFAPVGDAAEQVELRYAHGGEERVLFGRPRLLEFDTTLMGLGSTFVRAGFVAQDPRIYAGALSTDQTGLPTQTGGLTVPFVVPFTVDGVLNGGSLSLLNAGTTDTGLVLRIDGPVADAQVILQRPDGSVQSIRFDLTLATGQWLDIDTAARTALLNGLPGANQRGRAVWDIDPYPLPGDPSGAGATTTLRFESSDFNPSALLTAFWRSAWW